MVNCVTLYPYIKKAAERLEKIAGSDAFTEARLLAAHAVEKKSLSGEEMRSLPFPEAALARFDALVAQRLTGEPIQYILGEWEFMGLTIKTDSRALIPRQDTETLCEKALELIASRGYESCLDMCCGTGCIGVALARLGGVRVAFADVSQGALSLAQENCALNGVEGSFIQSDLFGAVSARYDIIACNPPYLSARDMACIQRELEFEPQNALFGGADGLDFYLRLAVEAMPHVLPGGALIMEAGAGQAAQIAAMFEKAWRSVAISRDLNGIERVVTALI